MPGGVAAADVVAAAVPAGAAAAETVAERRSDRWPRSPARAVWPARGRVAPPAPRPRQPEAAAHGRGGDRLRRPRRFREIHDGRGSEPLARRRLPRAVRPPGQTALDLADPGAEPAAAAAARGGAAPADQP